MNKNTTLICSIALAVGSAQLAKANLIDSFEGSTIFQPTGATLGFSTDVGVTEGSQSLSITGLPSGFQFAIESFDTSIRNALLSQTAILLDITPVVGSSVQFLNFEIFLSGSAPDGFRSIGQLSLDQVNVAETLTWILDSPSQNIVTDSTEFLGLVFVINSGDDFTTADTVYFDNLRTIPEPSTAGLLIGVGALGLAFLRRRR